MCRAIKILLLLLLVVGGVAVYFAVTSGGEKFRQAGQKTEQAGKAVKKSLDQAAVQADETRKLSDSPLSRLRNAAAQSGRYLMEHVARLKDRISGWFDKDESAIPKTATAPSGTKEASGKRP